jgi:hypothetical protein
MAGVALVSLAWPKVCLAPACGMVAATLNLNGRGLQLRRIARILR